MFHPYSPRISLLKGGWRRGPSWVVRLMTAIALLVGLAGPMTARAAQESAVENNTYTNPDDDWAIEWDGDVYTTADDFNSWDLVLWGPASTIFFQTFGEGIDDAEACLDLEADTLGAEDGVDNFELMDDANGDPFEKRDPEHAYAAYSLVYTGSDGSEEDRVNLVDCYVLEEGQSALSIILIAPADEFDAEFESYQDLVSNLELPSGGAEPTREPTEEPTRRATRTPTEEPTREPTEEPTQEAQQGADEEAGTYVSPTFGYAFEWNPDEWTVEDDSTVDDVGRDRLLLERDDHSSRVYFEGSDEWNDNLDECVSVLVEELIGDPAEGETTFSNGVTVSEIEPLEDPETGDVIEGSDGEMAYAAYSYVYDDGTSRPQDQVLEVQCHLLDEDAGLVLGVSHISLADTFFEHDRELVQDIVDSLETPSTSQRSGRDETRTPEARTTRTPEARATRTPEADDTPQADLELEGVDGNTYESPSFGYTLEWDEDIWLVLLSVSEPQDDFLILVGSNGLSMFVWGMTDYGEDTQDCFDGAGEDIAAGDGVDNVEILPLDESGTTTIDSGDGLWVAGIYTYEQDGEQMASFVQCVALEGEDAVIQVQAFGTADALQANLDSVDEVLATLTLP